MKTPIIYTESFITNPDAVFNALWNELAWERRGSTPRREYYCNELSVPYVYGRGAGKREYLPQPWHAEIKKIQEQVELACGAKMEVCFLNGYEHQREALGWHADSSPEMDDARPICIVSLGAVREIQFRPQGIEYAKDVDSLKLANGSLCIMKPGMQDTHYHRIPKAGHVCGPRISLTFRGYVA